MPADQPKAGDPAYRGHSYREPSSGDPEFYEPLPISIPPPRPVRIAAVLVLVEALGLLALAVATLVSGLTEDIAIGRTFAQFGYYVVLAALLVLCASAVLRGRRWGRTPCLVVQVVLVAIGVWMVAPSGQYGWGIGVIALGAVTGYLLVSRPANEWINRFPLPFAEPDQ
jgi:drug/metabolite transporter superfamily protein YnfA